MCSNTQLNVLEHSKNYIKIINFVFPTKNIDVKKYTIKDIAELAGVSKGTVDRVIHKRGKVSEHALKKVTEILESIDFVPNPMARQLKINKRYKIAVVLPYPKTDSYWQPCTSAVEKAKKEFNAFGVSITPYFFDPRNPKSFLESNILVLKDNPDGVLLASLFYNETLEVVSRYAQHNVIVSTFNNQTHSNLITNFVGQNLFNSGRAAARLMELITPENATIIIVHVDEVFKNAIHMQEKEKGFRDYFLDSSSKRKLTTLNCNLIDLEKNLDKLVKDVSQPIGYFVTNSKTHVLANYANTRKIKYCKIIGYDLVTKNINLLKSKSIDFLIHQNPKQQTFLGISYLVDYFLFEKQIPKQKLLAIDIIHSENVDSYINRVE